MCGVLHSVCVSGIEIAGNSIMRMIEQVGRVVTLHIGRAVEALLYQINGRILSNEEIEREWVDIKIECPNRITSVYAQR